MSFDPDLDENITIVLVLLILALLFIILVLFLKNVIRYWIIKFKTRAQDRIKDLEIVFVLANQNVPDERKSNEENDSNANAQAYVYLPAKIINVRNISGNIANTIEARKRWWNEAPIEQVMRAPTSDYFMKHPTERWSLEEERLRVGKFLGKGSFSRVFKGSYTKKINEGTFEKISEVAVKQLLNGRHRKEFEKELDALFNILAKASPHNHILELFGVCEVNCHKSLIVEYCENGNLRNFLRNQRPMVTSMSCYSDNWDPLYIEKDFLCEEKLRIYDCLYFGAQIANGLAYLHDINIIHSNIAARNILVTSNWVMKIADFGFCHDSSDAHKHAREELQIKWHSIEKMLGFPDDEASNIWSFGVLLWEIITLCRTPYPTISEKNLCNVLLDHMRLKSPEYCPKQLTTIMISCWQRRKTDRPTFVEVEKQLEHLMNHNTNNFEILHDLFDSSRHPGLQSR